MANGTSTAIESGESGRKEEGTPDRLGARQLLDRKASARSSQMWSKPVAFGLLAVAMYHGRGRGMPMSRVTPASKAPPLSRRPGTDVQTGSRASGTDGARCPGCCNRRLKQTHRTRLRQRSRGAARKSQRRPAGPFVSRTHRSAAETTVDPASAAAGARVDARTRPAGAGRDADSRLIRSRSPHPSAGSRKSSCPRLR